MANREGKNFWIWAAIGLLLGGASFFYLSPFVAAFDTAFHLRFQSDFFQALTEGNGFPDWDARPFGGRGTAAFRYYAPGPYLIGSIFLAIGASPWVSLKLTALFYALIGVWGLKKWFKTIGKGQIAWLAVVCFFFNPITTIHLNQMLFFQNICAMFLFPCLMAGWVNSAGWKKIGISSISLGAIGLTHLPTAMMAGYCLALLAVVEGGISREGKPILLGIAVLALAGALIAPYALPAMASRDEISFNRLSGNLPWNRAEFLNDFGPAISSGSDYQAFWTLLRFEFQVAFLGILLIGLIGFVGEIIWMEKLDKGGAGGVTAFLIFFLMLRPSLILWQNLPGLSILQFPWRLMWPAFILILPFSFPFADKPGKAKKALLFVPLLLWCALWLESGLIQRAAFPVENLDKVFDIVDFPREYLPATCLEKHERATAASEVRKIVVEKGSCTIQSEKNGFARSVWNCTVAGSDADLRIITHWDPNWRMQTRAGQNIALLPKGDCGLIGFSLPPGEHEITLFRIPPKFRGIGWILFSIAISVLWFGARKELNRKEKKL